MPGRLLQTLGIVGSCQVVHSAFIGLESGRLEGRLAVPFGVPAKLGEIARISLDGVRREGALDPQVREVRVDPGAEVHSQPQP